MKKYSKNVAIVLVISLLFSLLSFNTSASGYNPQEGAFVFDSEEMLQYITATHNLNVIYDPYENALRTVVGSWEQDPDPYFLLDVSILENTLHALEYQYLLITYRCPQTNSKYAATTEVFLSAGEVAGPAAGHSVLFDTARGEAYAVQEIQMASVSWWKGDVHNIRIDTFTQGRFGDTMYIDSIILCHDEVQAQAIRTERLKNAGASADMPVSDFICNRYDVQKYTSPVWEGEIIYNEAVYPIKGQDGSAVYTLMYTPDTVQAVYDATFSKLYQEGIDYKVEGNQLTILPGGSVGTFAYDYIHPQSNPNNYGADRYYNRTAAGDGKWEYWGQSSEFFGGYLNITYTHSDVWNGYVPENKADALPITSRKLENNENLNVVFFGDSITGGANASSYRDLYPYAQWWNQQIVSKLEETYGCTNIFDYYSSVGGSTASGMVSAVQDSVIQYAPDLVFIAFGMNDCMNESQSSDGSLKRVRAAYKAAIEQMVQQVRAQYPDCEFVLVSPFYANPFCHYQSYFNACRDVLIELESVYIGVVCADVTSMQASMLEYKDYLDFSGDNMCHPNDFMSRLYAQVCLETIVPGGIDAYVPAGGEDSGEEPDGPGEDTGESTKPSEPGGPGDIDGDGEVTIRDIGALRLYLADKIDGEELLLEEVGDVDKDGELTVRDTGMLRLYLADKITLE
ncbi:MAG: SGNH/GDSL hydrolase family protein [Clostridiales bacterium]|jgi:lysophospholipase L1-like esterase|nr:SGNH/GDSL hydrolase family protein [Clostridiales bacterium]